VSPNFSNCLTALVWAAGGGLFVWLVTYRLRRRGLGWLLASVVLTGVVSTVSAVIGSVRSMALSDSAAAMTISVALVAGLVASALAARAARSLTRDNQVLRAAITELGAGRVPSAEGPRLTAQLEQLRRELAETAQRLAGSRERERALESSRRELVAWVSHDLRTPLASLRATSEALEDGVADSPERYYKQIHASVDRLTTMVDDLFELSRIQSRSFALETEQVALDDLVSDCIAALDPLARAQGVRLAGHATGAASVVGNGAELNRALTNLVANAIRHTRADGVVEVVVSAADGRAEVIVHDECGGIPAEELDRIFEVGFRGEPARSAIGAAGGGQGGAGAGLGLAITRGIVEAHGGSVDVANIGHGCSFTVRLPAAA
jgi:signal transduction histidine kinase